MAASSNTEVIGIYYCRKCRKKRKFYKVKIKAKVGEYSHGMPTQYICSRGHSFDIRPKK